MNRRACLVTGGCGFIGSHPTGKLLKEDPPTVVLDGPSTGKSENLQAVLDHPSLTIVKRDLKKRSKVDYVI